MQEDMNEQLVQLERALAELEKAARSSLGFVQRIEHRGLFFDVGRRFVIADMAPLAFFHLVEHVDQQGKTAAIHRLYDRLMPLLTCRHEWTPLKRASDKPVLNMGRDWLLHGDGPHVCKHCTAYVLGGPKTALPLVGKKVA